MGRPQWETVVAAAQRESLVTTVNTLSNLSLNAGASLTADLYPPSGFIGELLNMFTLTTLNPGSFGAASGDHTINIGSTGNQFASYAYAAFDKATNANFDRMAFGATTLLIPNDPAALIAALRSAHFDSQTGLRLTYKNNSNVNMTGFTIYWNVTWKKKLVG